MLEISPSIRIREDEIKIDYVQAAGPGGQNVNKTATAAQLRFDVSNSTSLSENVKNRLVKLAGKRLTVQGTLIIEARRFRSREANRQDAMERLASLLRRAAEKPRPRKATRPSAASKEERLREKKRRSEIKKTRRDGPQF